MLDALYDAWKIDSDRGLHSLMLAGDTATVNELNARARSDRVASGFVVEEGVDVAGAMTAGANDLVVTRENNRRLTTGTGWVKNGDVWTVVGDAHADGSMTVTRVSGHGSVVLPASYVAENVELAYASTAHRAQGRTVDTAHAFASPTTTREVLYVALTRGSESNHLYVDTHYDPDPVNRPRRADRDPERPGSARRDTSSRGSRRVRHRHDPSVPDPVHRRTRRRVRHHRHPGRRRALGRSS
jgi:hypothetical protein